MVKLCKTFLILVNIDDIIIYFFFNINYLLSVMYLNLLSWLLVEIRYYYRK